jgi:hypothetical protein
MVFEEASSADRSTIPPVSRPNTEHSGAGSGWLPILLVTVIVALVLAATHVHWGAPAQAGVFQGVERVRPVLITEMARRPSVETSPGHRKLLRAGAIVPGSAVVQVRGTPTVFVSEADYRFVATPVVLGEPGKDGLRVLSGISAGQVVVTDGAEALKAQLALR